MKPEPRNGKWFLTAMAWMLAFCAPTVFGADLVRELPWSPGESKLTIQDSVLRSERHVWRWQARQGEDVRVQVYSLERNALFDLWTPGTRWPEDEDADPEGVRLTPDTGTAAWQGSLHQSGTYLLVVASTRGNASYVLVVTRRN